MLVSRLAKGVHDNQICQEVLQVHGRHRNSTKTGQQRDTAFSAIWHKMFQPIRGTPIHLVNFPLKDFPFFLKLGLKQFEYVASSQSNNSNCGAALVPLAPMASCDKACGETQFNLCPVAEINREWDVVESETMCQVGGIKIKSTVKQGELNILTFPSF
eukprot:Gb_03725 [translate_table: standard]